MVTVPVTVSASTAILVSIPMVPIPVLPSSSLISLLSLSFSLLLTLPLLRPSLLFQLFASGPLLFLFLPLHFAFLAELLCLDALLFLFSLLLLAHLFAPDFVPFLAFRLDIDLILFVSFAARLFLARGYFIAHILAADISDGVEDEFDVVRGKIVDRVFHALVDIAPVHGAFNERCGLPSLTRQ
jgi:hypothetical protein